MSDAPLHYRTIAELARAILDHSVSPVELTRAYHERIERLNPDLNAFIAVTADAALAQAREAEAEMSYGTLRGPLHGIPLALKDIIDAEGVVTTCGASFLGENVAERDAAVWANLREAGAVLLGKTHLLEFAMGGTDKNETFGYCANPWAPGHFSGGSSTGSGAAVAAGLCAGALGTDTGGSVRQPASYCNLVGIKPTPGLLPLEGVFPLSPTLDTVGPMTRTAEDNALMLDAILGGSAFASALRGATLTGKRVGVPWRWTAEQTTPEVAAAIEEAAETFSAAGAEVAEVDLHFGHIARPYGAIAFHEGMLTHRAQGWYPDKPYGPNPRKRLDDGAATTPAEYAAALETAAELRREADAAAQGFDALLLPTQPMTAPAFGQEEVVLGGKPVNAAAARGLFNMAWNVIGWAAISTPGGFSGHGQPIGIQLAGTPGSDAALLALAHAYQQVTDWHTRRPPSE
ncbi:MAG: amidase [Chloroflexota bacterium]|nr:amidase [Chloroflexota bacterium]